jgi:hypothetical protein
MIHLPIPAPTETLVKESAAHFHRIRLFSHKAIFEFVIIARIDIRRQIVANSPIYHKKSHGRAFRMRPWLILEYPGNFQNGGS